MRNLSRVIFVLVLLLLATSIATAGGPELGPFSTTGYTTNLFDNPFYDSSQPPGSSNPPLLPTEFVPLPSGHTKFHISAQGGPDFENPENDALCDDLYGGLFTPEYRPVSCQTVCFSFAGQACGTTGMFDGGSFSFEEWGVYYPLPSSFGYIGANHGELIIDESSYFQFAGQVTEALQVEGNFEGEEGEGTYSGDASFAFTVDYTPCKKGNCQRCAVFGDDELDVEENVLEWTFSNEGNKKVKIQDIVVNWPVGNGGITSVSVVDTAVYDYGDEPLMDASVVPGVPGYYGVIPADLLGKNKDVMIKKGASRTLILDFQNDVSLLPEDYTILVEFDQGCAATFVSFSEE